MRYRLMTVAFLVSGCACVAPEAASPPPREPIAAAVKEEKVIRVTGSIVYVPLEGGFFGIMGEDGRKYDPRNLPAQFQKDGLAVQATLRPLEGVLGFHMWGQIVEVVEIRKR